MTYRARVAAMICVLALAPTVAWAEKTRFDTPTETTHRQITWDDFKGRLTRTQVEQAQISTAIQTAPFEVKMTRLNKGFWVAAPLALEFYAAMSKVQSGAGKAARTDQLLAHEQGHFDLTEIMARRLGHKLVGVEAHGETSAQARAALIEKVERAHRVTVDELNAWQAEYDRATHHGVHRRQQRQWTKKINAWLSETVDPLHLLD
ncbi:MAG: DUF922 domain-containing protein [Acidobacteriota bacterium]